MKTRFFKIDSSDIDMKIISQCVEILKSGGTVAFPTETVYGLGANALDENAVKKIFKAKGRPVDNPLILHVTGMDDVEKYAHSIPPVAYTLAKVFWPGPFSMILHKKDIVPYAVTGGLDTVAFRVPSDTVAYELIHQSGLPIAAPSANISGRPSTTDGSHVKEDLDGKVDAIIDAGKCRIGLESTVVDLTSFPPCVLRPGGTPFEHIEMIIPDLNRSYSLSEGNFPKSPGMKYKHYSPNASLIVIKGSLAATVEKISDLLKSNPSAGVLCSAETVDLYKTPNKLCVGSRSNPMEIASNIFDSLRMFDKLAVNIIYSEYFDVELMGEAVMNRLLKAAGHELIVL